MVEFCAYKAPSQLGTSPSHPRRLSGLVVIALASALTACTNLTPPAQVSVLEHSKVNWLQYDATRRGALVYATEGGIKTCAEPSPDAAVSLVSKLEATSKPTGSEDGKEIAAKAELNSTIVDLAKRTQTVAFLREALFRLCEQSLNSGLTPKQLNAAYIQVIQTALSVAKTDQAQAEATKALAERTAEEAKQRTLQMQSIQK